MWSDVHELTKAHGAPYTPRGWKPRHQITTASLDYHESTCRMWQHIRRPPNSAEARRRLLGQRHLQTRSPSHDLVPRRGHTANPLQSLCPAGWRLANVQRTCPLDASACSSIDDSHESACTPRGKKRAGKQQGVAQRHAERTHTPHGNRPRTTTKHIDLKRRGVHPSQGQRSDTVSFHVAWLVSSTRAACEMYVTASGRIVSQRLRR